MDSVKDILTRVFSQVYSMRKNTRKGTSMNEHRELIYRRTELPSEWCDMKQTLDSYSLKDRGIVLREEKFLDKNLISARDFSGLNTGFRSGQIQLKSCSIR